MRCHEDREKALERGLSGESPIRKTHTLVGHTHKARHIGFNFAVGMYAFSEQIEHKTIYTPGYLDWERR
jgi:hypothetical protein